MKKISVFLSIFIITLCSSCSGIFDSIKDYANEESVYVGKFNEPVGYAGYERVEIYLLDTVRVPEDQINLGKAKNTVYEYDGKAYNMGKLVSWLNITGITVPKLYRFKIYNIDEFGNKSIPVEIALIPCTKEDVDALVLPSPLLTISPTTAEFTWPNGLSSGFFDYVDLTYKYIDKDGSEKTGEVAETQKFVVNNLVSGVETAVEIKCRIIPKINNIPIIDTLVLEKTFMVKTVTAEEYLATRSNRAILDPVIDGTQGAIVWGDSTEHLVWSEVRYKTNSGATNIVRTLAGDSVAYCPDIKVGELFETRSAFTPTGTTDLYESVWVEYDVPFLHISSGTYVALPESYRLEVKTDAMSFTEYANKNEIKIAWSGIEEYSVSDIFGGFYSDGRGYDDSYRILAHIKFDGVNFSMIDAGMDPWGTGFTAVTGTHDAATKTISLQVFWGEDYIFYLKLKKE
ncbi:MAG: DUF5012 domain-containing protein [Prevotellaceae bacterium]|jgi:hypothetical protein|nr:DUF5012 domain-containing protein [Prevotellaceae bacterium]